MINNKNWEERESELEHGFTNGEVKEMLKEITGDRCAVCNGVVDYHIPEVAKLHLKMLSLRGSPASFWRGAATGAVLTAVMLVNMYLLVNWLI